MSSGTPAPGRPERAGKASHVPASEAKRKHKRTTMLIVDTGPEHRARFYRLVVGGRGSDNTVREELLVPDGDELKTTHRHEVHGEAAA